MEGRIWKRLATGSAPLFVLLISVEQISVEQIGVDIAFLIVFIPTLLGGGLLTLAAALGLGTKGREGGSNLPGAQDLSQY